MATIRNIVVATDFSEASDAAVERAVQLAVVHSAALCLLHAIDDTAGPAPEGVAPAEPGASAPPPDDPLRQRLAAIAASLAAKGPLEVTIHCEAGSPATVIEAYARTHDCSLVVAGSRADPALSGLGSTASKVVQMPACPTLVVRATERRPYTTILSAVDLREGSLRAAALAIDLFPKAHHHLLYALDPELPEGPGSSAQTDDQLQSEYDSLRSQVDLDLRQLAQRLSRQTAHPVQTLVADDVPARAILVGAATLGADCVVVGHHGEGPPTDRSLGSMAQHVIHSALSDVLVVP